MSLDGHADVVVIGFGVAGAAAALAAADCHRRVLVLDQSVPTDRRFGRSRSDRARASLRARLRAKARAAGVEVHAQCRVHELVVDAGRVSGVGFATLPSQGVATTGHRWLQKTSALAPASAASLLTRAAEAMWRSRFRVGEISCSSVVLALDPRHWEFVGPAMWSAAPAPAGARPPVTVPVAGADASPSPELTVRRWCASCAATPLVPEHQQELEVDESTGAVMLADGRTLPGLYSAVGSRRAYQVTSPTWESLSPEAAASGGASALAARSVPWPPSLAPATGGPGASVHSSSIISRRTSRRSV